MKLSFIRHGLTEGNQKKWYYGVADIPLQPEGVEGIKALAAEGIYPEAEGKKLYTSGLIRTEQTFELIFGDAEHQVDKGFAECNFGEFEKHSYNELKDWPNYQAWIEDKTGDFVIPGGESINQFRGRVIKSFEKLIEQGQESIVVCHGGVISAIMFTFFPDVHEYIFAWVPKPGRGFTVTIEDGKPVSYEAI